MAASGVVVNRFPEFKKVAQANGFLVYSLEEYRDLDFDEDVKKKKEKDDPSKPKSEFMETFFQEVKVIQNGINKVFEFVGERFGC